MTALQLDYPISGLQLSGPFHFVFTSGILSAIERLSTSNFRNPERIATVSIVLRFLSVSFGDERHIANSVPAKSFLWNNRKSLPCNDLWQYHFLARLKVAAQKLGTSLPDSCSPGLIHNVSRYGQRTCRKCCDSRHGVGVCIGTRHGKILSGSTGKARGG